MERVSRAHHGPPPAQKKPMRAAQISAPGVSRSGHGGVGGETRSSRPVPRSRVRQAGHGKRGPNPTPARISSRISAFSTELDRRSQGGTVGAGDETHEHHRSRRSRRSLRAPGQGGYYRSVYHPSSPHLNDTKDEGARGEIDGFGPAMNEHGAREPAFATLFVRVSYEVTTQFPTGTTVRLTLDAPSGKRGSRSPRQT
jgi:hypothetical protein